jgi:glucose/arabinose dehydrogenase
MIRWLRLAWLLTCLPGTVAAAGAGDLTVPAGFRIECYAAGLGGARALTLDPAGVPLVSVPARGKVVALPPDRAGRGADVVTVLRDLDRPHGIAFRRGHLYVAETGRIVRYRYDPTRVVASDPVVVVANLPPGGHHWTRSIAFGPDDRLYVAIGSSCEACPETDPRRATIVRYDAEGAGEEIVATGLRNPVGLAFQPTTGALWTTVNERDWRSGEAPPDYVTDIRAGAAFGWPRCFAAGRRWLLDPAVPAGAPCAGLTLPSLELPPHSAPLGLAFYTGRQFPAEYAGNLFVALHGSRAGLAPAGYRVLRVRFRDGQVAGVEDFATGWRTGEQMIGRPVDLAVGPDGSLYVSDDHGDRVYRVTYSAR